MTNVVKHRPPKNRKPLVGEVRACSEWLRQEMEAVQPRMVVALGEAAGTLLQGRKVKLAVEHGQGRMVEGRMVVEMYHPAASMHNPNLWPVLCEDFRKLKRVRVKDEKVDYRIITADEAASKVQSEYTAARRPMVLI